jgi:branched-chain amino acid aminotransferase
MKALDAGKLKEAFASGTAAVISPVGKLNYKGKEYYINQGKVGPLAQKLYDHIIGIQYGKIKDPYGWMEKVS